MITINGNNIYTSYGLIFQELTGMLDMPKRKGLISRDWGTSIEPFLDAADIEFEGRNLELKCFGDIPAILTTGLLSLGTDWGTFAVYCQDEIKHDKKQLIIPLFEPIWTLATNEVSGTDTSGFRINGYNLSIHFGMTISEVSNLFDIPKRIDVGTTDYYKITQYRESGIINLTGLFEANQNGDLVTNIKKLYSVLISSGIKTFTFPDNSTYQVYAADGCQIKYIYPNMATFSLTLRKA